MMKSSDQKLPEAIAGAILGTLDDQETVRGAFVLPGADWMFSGKGENADQDACTSLLEIRDIRRLSLHEKETVIKYRPGHFCRLGNAVFRWSSGCGMTGTAL